MTGRRLVLRGTSNTDNDDGDQGITMVAMNPISDADDDSRLKEQHIDDDTTMNSAREITESGILPAHLVEEAAFEWDDPVDFTVTSLVPARTAIPENIRTDELRDLVQKRRYKAALLSHVGTSAFGMKLHGEIIEIDEKIAAYLFERLELNPPRSLVETTNAPLERILSYDPEKLQFKWSDNPFCTATTMVSREVMRLELDMELRSMNEALSKDGRNPEIRSDVIFTYDGSRVVDHSHVYYLRNLAARLISAGLFLRISSNPNSDTVYFHLRASSDRLMTEAQRIKLRKRLRLFGADDMASVVTRHPAFDSIISDFDLDKIAHFDTSLLSKQLFSSLERIRLICSIIESSRQFGGAEFAFERNDETVTYTSITMCHDDDEKLILRKEWVYNLTKPQPLDKIREYFGEEIGMYYAFLGHYTMWLTAPAFLGCLLWLIDYAGDLQGGFILYYTVFIVVWATFFLEFWKRRQTELAFRWDMADLHYKDIELPGFRGVKVRHPVTHEWKLSYPMKYRAIRYCISFSSMILCMAAAILMNMGTIVLSAYLQKTPLDTYGAAIAAATLSVSIIVGNIFYEKFAGWLSLSFENPKHVSQYELSYALKLFSFNFVTQYFSLFYIAFAKGRFDVFGVTETCSKGAGSCWNELGIQIGTLLIIQMLASQAGELVFPFAMKYIEKLRTRHRLFRCCWSEDSKLLTTTTMKQELQCHMADYWIDWGTRLDYCELAIQFGFVMLFASAFPAAAALALINNFIEIHTDSFKLDRGFKRPSYRPAKDIGMWQLIFDFILTVCIPINTFLLLTTGRSKLLKYIPSSVSNETLLIIVIIIEHFLIVVKFGIQKFVPDVPKWVHEAMYGNDFLRYRALSTALDLSKEKENALLFERRRQALIKDWQSKSSSEDACVTELEAASPTPSLVDHCHGHDHGSISSVSLGDRLGMLGVSVAATRYD